MRLHDLLDRVATADEPPSPATTGADLYSRAVRRGRLVKGCAAAAVGVAVIGSVLTAVTPPQRQDTAGTPGPSTGPTASASAEPDVPSDVDPGVAATPSLPPGGSFPGYQVGGHGQHLYLFTESGCYPCANQMWGSDDGGRTWTFRQFDVVAGDAILVAPSGAVASAGFEPNTRTALMAPRISTDGGRTSSPAAPVASIEGSTGDRVVYCRHRSAPDRAPAVQICDVMIVDFPTRTYGPLRTQPGFDVYEVWPGVSDVLWASGSERRGDERTMVVARSTDGGRTWAKHTFAGATTTLSEVYADLEIGLDGTVVADFTYRTPDGMKRHLARLRDGNWETLGGPPTGRPEADPLSGPHVKVSYIDSDGRHVMTTARGDGVDFWAVAAGGRTYVRISPPGGLPPKAYPDVADVVTYVPDLGYAIARQDGLWLSSDGKAWRKAKIN